MIRKTMADRKYELLRADREVQRGEMRKRLRELGDEAGLRELEAATAAWQQSEWAGKYEDMMTAPEELVTEQLKAAMTDLGASTERLASVRVVKTLREDVSAQMTPFSDGSGLVNVADATLTLCSHYARYISISLTQLASGSFGATVRAARAGNMGGDPAVLTGLLRYYCTNQRVYALAAKLGLRLDLEAEKNAAFLYLQASQFIIGHEIAHHALGHQSAVSGFSPDEHIPVCSDNQARELEADLFAYRASKRLIEQELAGHAEAADAATFSLLGALIAMLAVHLTERALFIRRGCTHPSARVRSALLLDQVGEREQQFARIFLSTPLAATEAASTISEEAQLFSWELAGTPPVYTSLPHMDMLKIAHLDAWQCRPESWHLALLESESQESGAWLGEAAQLAVSGNPAEALRLWGVRKAGIAPLCDSAKPLLFFTLMDSLRQGFKARGVESVRTDGYALAAATLAARHLT
ncbi:hypothetical protein OG257_30130 [Streptomyces sp. NBC_00683]|uniref:hypothetical protein n=1 Tax=Streptomyces sp. NBC_00683 TaxID=2903670 RepID=UPI002E375349|nr:hypothetical protein [Streptomyces sp. NBC_00683]